MKKYLSLMAVALGVFIGFNTYLLAAQATLRIKVLKEGQVSNDAHGSVVLVNGGNVQKQNYRIQGASEPVTLQFFDLVVGSVTAYGDATNGNQNCWGTSEEVYQVLHPSDTIRDRMTINMNCN